MTRQGFRSKMRRAIRGFRNRMRRGRGIKQVFTRKYLSIEGRGRGHKKIKQEVRLTFFSKNKNKALTRDELRRIANKIAAENGWYDVMKGNIERYERLDISRQQAKREGILNLEQPEIETYSERDRRYSNTP